MAITKGRTATANQTSTLKVGDAAPDFTLPVHNSDQTWTLSSLKGEKNVALVFYPFAFTPV
jgi:peroxiredoxin